MDSIRIVLPVHLEGGGLSVHTTTSTLGGAGVFVRSIVRPKTGAEMALRISLPGIVRPVAVRGVITDHMPAGAEGRGFFVEFRDLTRDVTVEINAVLRARGSQSVARPTAEPNRRSFERAPARFQVSWPSAKEFLVAYSENISRGGIFVVTDDAPPLREIIELTLQLPDGGPPVRTRAEVVQRTTAAEATKLGRPAGAGMQFVGGDQEFRTRLDACLEKLLRK